MVPRLIYTQSDLFDCNKPSKIESSSSRLLKFRLWFYGLLTAYSVSLALRLLSIDYGAYEDPTIRKMEYMRFTLLTVWINLMHLFYFPLCFYVDWHEMKGLHFENRIKALNKFRHFLFTAFIYPSTLYAGSFFWRVWNLDRELIVPNVLDQILPLWAQHCLHSVSVVVCMIELCVVPRFKPQTTYYHLLIIKIYLAVYLGLGLWIQQKTGDWPYPFFGNLSPFALYIFLLFFWMEYLFIFYTQWLVTDFIWGSRLTSAIVHK